MLGICITLVQLHRTFECSSISLDSGNIKEMWKRMIKQKGRVITLVNSIAATGLR